MKLIIDITDYGYQKTIMFGRLSGLNNNELAQAIINGIVLPPGHGDLIDRSKIAFDWWSVHGHTCVGKENIFNMPVIVPADTEGEE